MARAKRRAASSVSISAIRPPRAGKHRVANRIGIAARARLSKEDEEKSPDRAFGCGTAACGLEHGLDRADELIGCERLFDIGDGVAFDAVAHQHVCRVA